MPQSTIPKIFQNFCLNLNTSCPTPTIKPKDIAGMKRKYAHCRNISPCQNKKAHIKTNKKAKTDTETKTYF